jgi:hypothetical protein
MGPKIECAVEKVQSLFVLASGDVCPSDAREDLGFGFPNATLVKKNKISLDSNLPAV